jgi:hypothetical protein
MDFTKRYDYIGKPSSDSLGVNIALEGRTLLSPYFPHWIIDTTYMSDGRCRHIIDNDSTQIVLREERYLSIDPFWNVFWIEIDQCNPAKPTRVFGPYRIPR